MEAANEAFGPIAEEIEHAQKVLAAWEAAKSQGQGAFVGGMGWICVYSDWVSCI